jgi:inward rectifier potassium channel
MKPNVTNFGQTKIHKLNAQSWEWRDAYHWLLTLSWPQFSACIFGLYLGINLVFSFCYHARPNCIAGTESNPWPDSFFFSVETLATVGYGHMYPATLYGHTVATVEIIVGMFGMAIVTGLIFIRFSRPVARIVFSEALVLCPFDGKPALMFRAANLRDQSMAEAEFRIILMREEPTKEDKTLRRFHPLKLQFDRLILFPAIITIRHIIDEDSPLHGATFGDMERDGYRFTVSIVCIDTVIPASVQSNHTYTWRDIRANHKFVEVYREIGDDVMAADYSQLHATEEIFPEK